MLEKFNPFNWLSSDEQDSNDKIHVCESAPDTQAGKHYIHDIDDKSRIENPKSPLDANEYRYGGVHEMSEPMYSYKATSEGVARLIIPRGATVVVPDTPDTLNSKKLRADEVYVDKILCVRGRGGYVDVDYDLSLRNWYEYHVGKLQQPADGIFDKSVTTRCAAGLHFFVEPSAAVRYYNRNGGGVSMRPSEAAPMIFPD